MSVEEASKELTDIFGMSFGQAKYLEKFIKSKKLKFLHAMKWINIAKIGNLWMILMNS